MAEEILYEEQVADNGDDPKDPLGLRKQLKQKGDPLGLRTQLAQAPATKKAPSIPTIDWGKPVFEKMATESTAIEPGVITQQQQAANFKPTQTVADKFRKDITAAQDKIFQELTGNDDVLERVIRNDRANAAQRQIGDEYLGSPRSDMPSVQNPALQVDPRMEAGIKPQDLPVNPEDITKEKVVIANDEQRARNILEKVAHYKPEKKNAIQSAIYQLDMANAIQNDPEGQKRVVKAQDNAKKLEKGELLYDMRQGRLYKPENITQSAVTGWKNKTQLFHDYDKFKNTENNDAIAMDLDARRKEQDPDAPIPVPEGALGELGAMAGGTPAKALLAGAAGGLAGPQGAAVAGGIVGGREFAKLQYAATFQQVYYELRDQGVDGFQAVTEARKQADQAAEVGFLTGAAMGAVGARMGIKPLPRIALNEGFRKAVVGSLKNIGSTLSGATKEGLALGGIAAGGQKYLNHLAKDAGIDRDLDEGTVESVESMLLFSLGMAAAVKGSKAFSPKTYRTILNGLSRADEGYVNKTLQEWVDAGQITLEQATKTKDEIAAFKKEDATIPSNVAPEARIEILEKIKKREGLEKQLEGLDKAYHPEIKEKIKAIDEEITGLSENKAEKEPKEQAGLKKLIDSEIEDGSIQGYTADVFKNAHPEDLPVYMKEIAEQAHDPATKRATIDTYGENIVNKAKEMFPKEVEKQKITVSTPIIRNVKMKDGSVPEYKITTEKGISKGDIVEGKELIASGSESTVYRDGDSVIKIGEEYSEPSTFDARVEDARIISDVLGDGSVELIGTHKSKNGTHNPIFRQKFIEGEKATPEQIDAFMESKGFEKKGNGYENEQYRFTDIDPDNVIVDKDGNVHVIDAGVRKLKPTQDAVQVEEALTSPEKGYGKSTSHKDLFPKRSQTQPKINRETAESLIGEVQTRRLQASLDWLEAVEGNNREAIKNTQEQIIRESLLEEVQNRDILASDDSGGAQIRTSGDYGGASGEKAASLGTGSPQERGQHGQSIGEPAITNASGTRQVTQPTQKTSSSTKNAGLSEAESRSVVKKVQQLSKLPNNGEKAQIIRSLRLMLEQSIREKLPQKTKGIIDLITENIPEHGTIRERISKEAALGETSGNRSEMGEGIPKPEEFAREEGAAESQAAGEKEIGITHARLDEIAKEFDFDTYEKDPETVAGWDFEAAKRLREDPNALRTLFDKLRSGTDKVDHIDNRMMIQYMADLKAKIDKNPTNERLAEFKRAKDLFDIEGRSWGKAGRARQGTRKVEESLPDFYINDQEANRGPLTDKQKETAKEQFEGIQNAKAKFEAAAEKAIEKKAETKAKAEIEKIKKESKKDAKKDYKQEQKDIVDDIRAKLKKYRGDTLVGVPYVKELIAIAPDVMKLVKSLVEQGIHELPAVVKAVHDEVKYMINGVTEKDVHNIIAGEYNQKKPKRSDIAEKVFDLKTEAKLINQLEALEAGIEPKSENKKKERNRKIEELKQQIREHDLTKLAEYKKRVTRQIAELEKQLKDGDFAKEEKEGPVLDEEALKLKDEYQRLKDEREIYKLKLQLDARPQWQKNLDIAGEAIRTGKVIKSSYDVSFLNRQTIVGGVKQLFSLPFKKVDGKWEYTGFKQQQQYRKQIADMYRSFGSETAYRRLMADIKGNPRFETAQKAGLSMSDPNSPMSMFQEEMFGRSLIDRIPDKLPVANLAKKGVKASNRAASAISNQMKWDIYNQFVEGFEQKGMTFKNSPDAYKEAAKYANQLVGRGFLGQKIEMANPVTSPIFWSLRLQASRLQLMTKFLNPKFYSKVPPEIRVAYFKDMAKFVATGIGILALANKAGASVELDPRSADFGTIKVGETRYDIWGGFKQYAVLFARLFKGSQKKSSGKIEPLREMFAKDLKFGEKTRGDVLGRFVRTKLTPEVGLGLDILSGEGFDKKPITPGKAALDFVTPLIYKDFTEALKDGGVEKAIATSLLSIHGIGNQTYIEESKYNENKRKSSRKKNRKITGKKTNN